MADNKMVKSTNDRNCEKDVLKNCFSELKHNAKCVDQGLKYVKSRIELCENAAEMLYLQRSRSHVNEIDGETKRMQNDFRNRSSTLQSISHLMGCALVTLKERLENIESFSESYGYTRPTQDIQSDPDIITECPSSSSVGIENESSLAHAVDDATFSAGMDDNDTNTGDLKSPPPLEQIGLSKHTLAFLKIGDRNFDSSKENSPPLSCQTSHPTLTNGEMLTPKLEGISERTMQFLGIESNMESKIPFEQSSSETNSSYQYSHHDAIATTPKLKPLDVQDEISTPKLEGVSNRTMKLLGLDINEDKKVSSKPKESSSSANNAHPLQSDQQTHVTTPTNLLPELLNEDEIATPKLEGISENTLMFLGINENEKIDYHQNSIKQNINSINPRSPEGQPYILHHEEDITTPKLKGLSECTMRFLEIDSKSSPLRKFAQFPNTRNTVKPQPQTPKEDEFRGPLLEDEMQTPKLEGVSERTMMMLGINAEQNGPNDSFKSSPLTQFNHQSYYSTSVSNTPKFDSPRFPDEDMLTPKLEGLSEKTMMLLGLDYKADDKNSL